MFDEVVELGFTGSYPAFTASVRKHELRPRCQACAANRNKDRSVIDHPAGEETQWDWLELPDPPAGWGWGETAHLLLGGDRDGRHPPSAGHPAPRSGALPSS